MLRLSYYTFGCKLNQSETEGAVAALQERGYQTVGWEEGADIYLINTCTVTARSEQKARRLIRQTEREHPQSLIVVCGCYAVVDANSIAALGRRVAVLARPQALVEKLPLQPLSSVEEALFLLNQRSHFTGQARADQGEAQPAVLPSLLESAPFVPQDEFPFVLPDEPFRQRYFFKIQDGCNRTCSFCRIRIARGRSRCLPLAEVVSRLRQLATAGYREIVITGVHINSYEDGDARLGDLLWAILQQTEGFRIRLSSLEPEPLSDSLAAALAHPRICPHFHLSLQSGSAHVLRQMRRSYSPALIERYAANLRQLQPDPFFSADVIVGFPGESDEDFQQTVDLMQRLDMAACHVFSYSARPGTDAATMKRQVAPELAQQRLHQLKHLLEQQQERYVERQLGRQAELLLEAWENGNWVGSTETYLRPVLHDPDRLFQHGQLVSVMLATAPSASCDSGERLSDCLIARPCAMEQVPQLPASIW